MAGDVHLFSLTVKGVALQSLLKRPLTNVQVREVDKEKGYIKLDGEACEIDLLAWFHEHEDIVGPYPEGTLITWWRIYS